jgi:protein phosphatase-4 regulatory subunit 3
MKPVVVARVMHPEYIPKLLSLFQAVEDLEVLEDAFIIFNIFKGIFMLNDTSLYDYLFSEDIIMQVIAALEYDPSLPKESTYTKHRDFLAKYV